MFAAACSPGSNSEPLLSLTASDSPSDPGAASGLPDPGPASGDAALPRTGLVVLVTAARYGLMQIGRCVRKDYGYIGCGSDVLGIADKLCSGRRACEVGSGVVYFLVIGRPIRIARVRSCLLFADR